jgi:hypothetical protein
MVPEFTRVPVINDKLPDWNVNPELYVRVTSIFVPVLVPILLS